MSEEKKNENDTKKLLEMSLDDIAKMNNEKRKRNKNQNKFSLRKNYRNNNNTKRQNKYNNNNNNRRIRGGNHFKRKYNNNYKSNYNKFDKFDNTKKNKGYEKETRTKIQITNLQKDIKDDELNKFFSSVGKIKSCIIQKDQNNNSLGIADIEYFNPESAKEAIKNFDNAEIEGTFMKVQYKNE